MKHYSQLHKLPLQVYNMQTENQNKPKNFLKNKNNLKNPNLGLDSETQLKIKEDWMIGHLDRQP